MCNKNIHLRSFAFIFVLYLVNDWNKIHWMDLKKTEHTIFPKKPQNKEFLEPKKGFRSSLQHCTFFVDDTSLQVCQVIWKRFNTYLKLLTHCCSCSMFIEKNSTYLILKKFRKNILLTIFLQLKILVWKRMKIFFFFQKENPRL